MPAEGLVPPDINFGGPERAIRVGYNSMLPCEDMTIDEGISRDEVPLGGVRPGILEHPLSKNPFRLVRSRGIEFCSVETIARSWAFGHVRRRTQLAGAYSAGG
jgi:hypothetical protein